MEISLTILHRLHFVGALYGLRICQSRLSLDRGRRRAPGADCEDIHVIVPSGCALHLAFVTYETERAIVSIDFLCIGIRHVLVGHVSGLGCNAE